MLSTPCKIRWTGPTSTLSSPTGFGDMGRLSKGAEGILVYPGLAAFSPDLALLYQVDEADYEVLDATDLGGWDGATVTPVLVKTLLDLEEAIPTLVEVMQGNPELGSKIVQSVMAGMD